MLPKLDSPDIEVAFKEAEMLAKAAGSVECFELASPHINSYLYNFGEKMYASIFNDPPRWLKMSCALKSGPIFKAAITHIVGQYPHWPWTSISNDGLPEELRSMIRLKVDEMSNVKSRVDGSLYASTLANGEQEVSLFNLDRPSINSWLVVASWRDWYCHSLSQSNVAGHMGKSDAQMYRLMARGGGTYLPLASVLEKLRELKGSNLTPADMEEAAHDLRIMKEYAAEQVKPLCINRSMLDVDDHDIGYFTCVEITDAELPWVPKDGVDEV